MGKRGVPAGERQLRGGSVGGCAACPVRAARAHRLPVRRAARAHCLQLCSCIKSSQAAAYIDAICAVGAVRLPRSGSKLFGSASVRAR